MAAPIYNLARGYFRYTSDNTVVYAFATNLDNNNAQTVPQTPDVEPVGPAYPRGWVARKVLGKYVSSGTTYKTHIPVFDPADAIWVGGTSSFSKGGQVFTIGGRIGEKRTYKGG